MSNTSISFDSTIPTDTDFAANGPSVIRSFKTAMQNLLGAEHIFPPNGGQAGAHALGSARVFVGPTSQVSSADTTGRLMIDSTQSQLWYVGSDATYPLGNPRAIGLFLNGLAQLPPAGRQFGISVVSVTQATWPSGPINISFFGAFAFQGDPFVFCSLATTDVSDLTSRSVTAQRVTPSNINVTVWNTATGSHSTLTATVHIVAVGVV